MCCAAQRRTMVKGRQGERIRLYVRGTILGYKRFNSTKRLEKLKKLKKNSKKVQRRKNLEKEVAFECLSCGGLVSKSNQYPNTSLIQIEGVNTKEEVDWYRGKRMAYIYKAKVKKNGSQYRCIWGKVSRPHGNSGVVRAKFKSNLPPRSMGARVRVFMYPSNI
ncbi:unnamed protein product [Camellia sinensis]